MQNEKPNFVTRILAMLVIGALTLLSATLNAKYWYGQAPSIELAQLMGGASFLVDLIKPMTPFFIVYSMTNRKPIAFLSGVLLLICCTAFSMVSAIGLSSVARYDGSMIREGKVDHYNNLKNKRKRIESSINASITTHHPDEIKTQLSAVLKEPIKRRGRSYGTVGNRSNNCTKSERYSRNGCARHAKLKIEYAAAIARQANIALLTVTDKELEVIRSKGLIAGTDPQARVFSEILGIPNLDKVKILLIVLFAFVLEYTGLIAPFLLFQKPNTSFKKNKTPPVPPTQKDKKEPAPTAKLKPFVMSSATLH